MHVASEKDARSKGKAKEHQKMFQIGKVKKEHRILLREVSENEKINKHYNSAGKR